LSIAFPNPFIFQPRRFIDLHRDGFGQHLFPIYDGSNKSIHQTLLDQLQVLLDQLQGESWRTAIISRAESQRHCWFDHRSVPRIILLFASIEWGFVRQFDSNSDSESSIAFSTGARGD
jgi:hypothetical protein